MTITPVVPDDLSDFAGAPFSATAVAIAAADVQAACRWHVAPQATETVTVATGPYWQWCSLGARFLQLPTLYLVSVTGVRDVTDPTNVQAITDYSTAPTADFRAGLLGRTGGVGGTWPLGSVFEVDMVHGYDKFPQDLLPAVAAVAQDVKINKATGAVRLGSLSISNNGGEGDVASRAIGRYRIPNIP